jgi:hypothetical protein
MTRSESAIELRANALGQLIFRDAEGKEYVGVEPVRMFPISDARGWVSLCEPGGHELAAIEDPSKLSPESRAVLEKEMTRREFIPQIEHIVLINADLTPAQWIVETDRGKVEFLVNSEEDIRMLGPDRVLIVDVNDVRYLIPDVRNLDRATQRILERYL